MNCVDDARIACPLFQAEYGGEVPTSALQLVFSKCNELDLVSLNAIWHSRLPRLGNSHFRICYNAMFNYRIYAVSGWSNPVARRLPQREWLELRRFAIAPDAPRYTASRMLGWMRRDIIKRFPEVVRLISYQDLDAHQGTIYKASGWRQAEGYKLLSRGGIGWATRPRKGRTNQCITPIMRWEMQIRPAGKIDV